MTREAAEQGLLNATGQLTVPQATRWIAEGHPILGLVSSNDLLAMLAGLGRSDDVTREATRRVARDAAASGLDTATMLFRPEWVVPPSRYRMVLELLKRKSPTGRLAGLTANAVAAAQREDDATAEALCVIAGIPYRDMHERLGADAPVDPAGPWPPQQLVNLFRFVDDVVRNRLPPPTLPGAVPARPVELRYGPEGGGWDSLDEFVRVGVPYEVLLTQRAVGGSWIAHRNRTSSEILRVLMEALCIRLDDRSVRYVRARTAGGSASRRELQDVSGEPGHVSLVIKSSLGTAIAGVVFSTAKDGGTARTNAGRLIQVARASAIPLAAVLAGTGWAARNETADLAVAFGGRIFTDQSIDALASSLADLYASS